MKFLDMLERRRSVRRFGDKEIAKEDIAKILKAALSAPSSKNTRSSSFMVVETREYIEKISQMRDMGSNFIKYAPMVIIVMGDAAVTDLWEVNATISATYLQLATESIGMGSCWVQVEGRPRSSTNPAEGTAEEFLKSFLPIPHGRRILCAIALGYPEKESEPRVFDIDEGKVTTV